MKPPPSFVPAQHRQVVGGRLPLPIIFGTTIATLCTAASGLAVALGASALAPLVAALVTLGGFLAIGEGGAIGVALLVTPLVPIGTRQSLLPITAWPLILALLVLATVHRLALCVSDRASLRISLGDGLIFLFVLWLTVSYVSSDLANRNPQEFLLLIALPLMMYIAGRIAFSTSHRQMFLFVAAVGATLAAIEIWFEHTVNRPLFASPDSYEWAGLELRAGSMLGGPNFAAAYMALGLAAIAPLISRARLSGLLAFVLALVTSSTYFATHSISGLIETATVFGILAFLWGNRAARVLVVLVAAVVFLSPVRDVLAQQDWVTSHNVSIESRFGLLDAAGVVIAYLTDQPLSFLVGVGYGQWLVLASAYSVSASTGPILALHNTFITLFLEDGLLATLPYVAMLVFAIASAWTHRSDPVRVAAGLAAGATMIVCGSATLNTIPQVFGFSLFLLAGASSTPESELQHATTASRAYGHG